MRVFGILSLLVYFSASSDYLLIKVPKFYRTFFQRPPNVRPIQMSSNKGHDSGTGSLEEKEPCRCGLHLTSPAPWTRIVGGAFVQYPHKYPWQIALLYSKYPKSPKAKFKLKCGASIIGPKTILTAAHCVVDLSPTEIRLGVGEHNLDIVNEADSVTMTVKKYVVHPEYDNESLAYDYAILSPSRSIPFSRVANAICLDSEPEVDYDGKVLMVAGWGTEEANPNITKTSSPRLKEALLYGINHKRCSKIVDDSIASREICAARLEGGTDSCEGDSGGPLMFDKNGRMVQVGVTSWGFGCAEPNSPGVYAKVFDVLDWILENSKSDEFVKRCTANQ